MNDTLLVVVLMLSSLSVSLFRLYSFISALIFIICHTYLILSSVAFPHFVFINSYYNHPYHYIIIDIYIYMLATKEIDKVQIATALDWDVTIFHLLGGC